MSGIIATPVVYTYANTGISFTSTDNKVLTATYEDTSGNSVAFGGGFLINATNSVDGSPVDASLLGAYSILENRPVVGTSGATTGWTVTIESLEPNGWFNGDTSYMGGLAVFASIGQLSYVTYSR